MFTFPLTTRLSRTFSTLYSSSVSPSVDGDSLDLLMLAKDNIVQVHYEAAKLQRVKIGGESVRGSNKRSVALSMNKSELLRTDGLTAQDSASNRVGAAGAEASTATGRRGGVGSAGGGGGAGTGGNKRSRGGGKMPRDFWNGG
jgi:hypothetical protein